MGAPEAMLDRVRRVPGFAFDAALALAALLVSILDLAFWLRVRDPQFPGHANALAYAILSVSAGALAFRRRNLWTAWAVSRLAVVIAVLAHTVYLEDVGVHIVIVIWVFTIAEQSSLPVAIGGGIAEYTLVIAGSWSEQDFGVFFYLFIGVFYFAGLLGLVWWAGRASRRRKKLISELEAQMEELRTEQERLARDAVAVERGRIARELHSLVMQGIEGIAHETASARMELAADSGLASKSIESIEATGRSALVEMGRVLSLMETTDDAAVPSLAATSEGTA